ncbi:30S ribosomal protein S8 [Kiritimatiella glycovorans]|uniref:Small ribosomal subunit protein uS8 n=1 Tax=Kiritimatiella glycovorans TaxID=1307763 RepID=A0A0G3EF31_9BACT|nr:30S ribosomal protein S8 [Kiritimatiella glycovorans]AKJ64943.1 30S ribosomal protein S8 [Kiritimatiella glycovorans]
MSLNDPIADMLTRIRNASTAGKESVLIPFANMNNAIAEILKGEGYISDFVKENRDGRGMLTLYLKYRGERRQPVIQGIRRVSRPGRRVYVNNREVPRVYGGIGTAILTTSSGLMSDREARSSGVGGEVLCYIW